MTMFTIAIFNVCLNVLKNSTYLEFFKAFLYGSPNVIEATKQTVRKITSFLNIGRLKAYPIPP